MPAPRATPREPQAGPPFDPHIDDTCAHLAASTDARAFDMRGPAGRVRKCLACALHDRRMLRRSFLTALVVGTILTLINHGPDLFAGDFSSDLAWKIPLTYLVPFCVTSWGALANAYLRHRPA